MSRRLEIARWSIACFVMALIITSERPANAGKPGGGGGTTIPGVIFFGVGNDPLGGNWAMNPDGTDKNS